MDIVFIAVAAGLWGLMVLPVWGFQQLEQPTGGMAVLAFNALGFVAVYALQRLQVSLPLKIRPAKAGNRPGPAPAFSDRDGGRLPPPHNLNKIGLQPSPIMRKQLLKI